MSENNSKSRRKVKLVARSNFDSEYENFPELEETTNTKIPTIKIERLPDGPNNSSLQDVDTAMPVPLFSIKVEVEQFSNAITIKNEYDSDNELVIDETDYTDLNGTPENVQLDRFSSLKPGTTSLNSKVTNETKVTKRKWKKKTKKRTTKELQHSEIKGKKINLQEVILETDKILRTTTSKVDRILAVEVKNMWGRIVDAKITKSTLDLMFERVFRKWNTKKAGFSRTREAPLFYKCYICNMSWWYLHPFREHLKAHDVKTFGLSLEDISRECNIIAYELGTCWEKRHIVTEGNCWRCNRNYAFHKMEQRLDGAMYKCVACHEKSKSYTCTQLREHESGCRSLMRSHFERGNTQIYQCDICILSFWSETELIEHTIGSHSVRSDVPTLINESDHCMDSFKDYIKWSIQNLCMERKMYNQCGYCQRLFQSPNLLEAHEKCTKKEFVCDVCDVKLPKHCMVPKHYIAHTVVFTLVYRCCICKDTIVFQNDKLIKHHCLQHAVLNETIKQYECIILPKCMVKEMDRTTIGKQAQQNNQIITTSELALVLNDLSRKSPERLKVTELQTSEETIKEVNAIQKSPVTDVKIKEEIIEEDDDVAPKFFVVDNDNIEPSIHIKDYEEMLSSMFQSSKTEPKIKTEIKSEPEDEYYEDDIIQLQMSLYNGQQTRNKETGDGETSSNSTESMGTTNANPEDSPINGYRKGKLYTCSKCGYKNFHKEYLVHRTSNCEQKPKLLCVYKYACTKCTGNFTTMRKYVEHFDQHGFEALSCPQCKDVLPSIQKLVLHLQCHIRNMFVNFMSIDHYHIEQKSKRGYKCIECKETVTEGQFFKHWERHLVIFEVKVEVICDDKLEDCDNVKGDRVLEHDVLKKVIAHLKENKTRSEIHKTCDVCRRAFDRKNDCKRHLIEHLLTDAWAMKPKYGGLRCQVCGATHAAAAQYKRHVREHAALPVYACALCDRAFSDSSNFAKHKKVHNQRAYRCDLCAKKFQAKASLERHMEVHKVTKPVQCPDCDKTCYTESALRKHERVHDKTRQNFRCDICGSRFFTLKDKWDHMWLKHKERRYKADCAFCSKKFRRFLDLKKHVKSEHNVALNMRQLSNNKQTEDIEEFLKNNSCLESGMEETLIVFD